MFPSGLSRQYPASAPRLIGLGLAIMLVAQWVDGVPVATGVALIGWGAMLALSMPALALANMLVYAVLVGYTIGSQSHAAAQSLTGHVTRLTSIDHLVALMLVAGLTWVTLRRTLAPAA